jgi:hypothetical protein
MAPQGNKTLGLAPAVAKPNPGGTGFQPVLIYDYLNRSRGQPYEAH